MPSFKTDDPGCQLVPPPPRSPSPISSRRPISLPVMHRDTTRRNASHEQKKCRNYYDTLAKLFGEKGVSAQLPALLKALPQNKRKLLQDVVDGLSKK